MFGRQEKPLTTARILTVISLLLPATSYLIIQGVILMNSIIEEELDARDLKRYIDKLVVQLPANRQRIFRMSRELHLSNKQIAEQCAITEKAVERQITLALKFIRDNLPFFVLFMRF